jgi:hypothetical protein
LSDWLTQITVLKLYLWIKIVNRNHALGVTNNRKVSGSVIRYFQPKMAFFYLAYFFKPSNHTVTRSKDGKNKVHMF